MKNEVVLNSIYFLSPDVVARDIDGELIIVPLTSGIGDYDDEIFTLNETGCAIWRSLDGKKSLKEVAQSLEMEFVATPEEIETDIVGLVKELAKRKMVVAT
jgi:hypothetical protein